MGFMAKFSMIGRRRFGRDLLGFTWAVLSNFDIVEQIGYRSGVPADQTGNVSLTAELNAFIRAQVESGQYQNASEVVRAGLRLLVKHEQRAKREAASSFQASGNPPGG